MTTQLFLKNEPCDTGTAGQFCARTVRGVKSFNKVTNTVTSGTNIQVTDTAGGTADKWLSDPILAPFTMSGNVTANVRGLESALTANAGRGLKITRTDALGNDISTVLEVAVPVAGTTEYTTSDAAGALASNAITSTSFNRGDRIGIILEVRNVGTMSHAASETVTNSIDGASGAAGDTSITFAETISFMPNTPYIASVGTGASASANALAVPVPAGVAIGDLIIVGLLAFYLETTIAPTDAAITPPAGGWKASGITTNVHDTVNGGWDIWTYWYKYATAADSGTYTFTGSTTVGGVASSLWVGQAVIVRNGPTFGNPFVDSLTNTVCSGSAVATLNVTAFTPGADGSLLLAWNGTTTGTTTWTWPATTWEQYGLFTGLGGSAFAEFFQKSKASTGTLTFAINGADPYGVLVGTIRTPSAKQYQQTDGAVRRAYTY